MMSLASLSHWLPSFILGISCSVVFAVGGLLGVRWAIVHMPPDYFVRHVEHSTWHLVIRAVLGITLVAAGIAMLLLPGPGIVAILMGTAILPFPGRENLVRWLLQRNGLREKINSMRRAHGRKPIVIP